MDQDLRFSPVCVLGIDPGISGAVCRIGKGRLDVRRDFKSLADIAVAIHDLSEGVDSAIIEFVHSRPGEGTCSVFSFGRSTGVAFGSLFSEGFGATRPLEEVHPVKWQNFFRQRLAIPREVEFSSREVASTILVSSSPYLARVKDHGTGDALLIAAYRLLQTPLLRSSCMTPRLLTLVLPPAR